MRHLCLLSLLVAGTTAFAQAPAEKPATATPAEELTVAPGFRAELLKSATKEEGSWICMAIDDKGRLYISTQGKPEGSDVKKDGAWGGLFRATLDAAGHIAQWEKVNVPVGDAMGMLWAFDSLYVSGDGPSGRGIYRLKDTNGDDQLDAWSLFHQVKGGNGEHGAHALVLGPDGKSIFVIHGNATPLIDGTDAKSPYRNYAEDDLLPRVMDPVATFFDKVHSPYGYVLKTDENGTKWELYAGGFRNPYDIDFNADGELFTYDSDMEWDAAMPWYRPTRVLHVVPGGEYGFREGSAKWPAYYPDSLPPAVNIGLGCPTGVKFGTKSNFPEKYKSAFFILDWTFGRILAVHLHPEGSTYTAKNPGAENLHLTGALKSDDVEEFVKGKGLPVTDVEFGKDGAMYFTIGGRGTQAGLYRVSWAGKTNSQVQLTDDSASGEKELRTVRRQLDQGPVPFENDDWFFLHGPDRFLRFSARLELERRPLESWHSTALEVIKSDSNSGPERILTVMLALARVGTKEDQEAILKALEKFHPSNPLENTPTGLRPIEMGDELMLDQLRVLEVAFARQGRPDTDKIAATIARLSPLYPAKTFPLNRELCELLVYLGAPDVIDKSLALMDDAKDPAEAIWYATCLREATGWTPLQREHYFSWFAKMRDYQGGNSARKFILRIRDQALEKVPAEERTALLALAEKEIQKPKPVQPMPTRPFVKAWTVADLVPALDGIKKGRDFARGEKLYRELMCTQCHLFAGHGGEAKTGAVGPDLTAVGSRFAAKDILESIIEPSKVISEQYASFLFTLKDGSMVGGQIAEENHYLLTLIVDPIAGTKVNYPKGNVVKREMSTVSLMPPGLIYSCSQDEVLDLLAYLQSGGNAKAENFAK